MTKTIITLVAALGISSTALANEPQKPNPMDMIDLALVTDTEYDIDGETTNTEFGVVAGAGGLSLSLLPNYDWDDSKVDTIEVGLKYDWKVTKSFTITPYGTYNVDTDITEQGKTIGVKTKYSF
tara:strand:- start:155 stop:526 length:372 start_codon:yes stop_codon:yes gene_type:complete